MNPFLTLLNYTFNYLSGCSCYDQVGLCKHIFLVLTVKMISLTPLEKLILLTVSIKKKQQLVYLIIIAWSYTELVVILLPGYQTIFFVGKLQE